MNDMMKPLALTGHILLFYLLCTAVAVAAPFGMEPLCDIHFPSDDRIAWECRTIGKKDTPTSLFGEQWQDVLRFNRLDRRHFVRGKSIKVPKQLETIRGFTPMPAFFPPAANEEKFILVDQAELFLGAYEFGRLIFSAPVAVGVEGHRVPNGEFRIDAIDRRHESDQYAIETTDTPYPMHYALRFYVDKLMWVTYWLHGRDLPGVPASHGCIGLYDEEMQKQYYETPQTPGLTDARRLYEWVVGSHRDTGRLQKINYGPKVLIVGTPPL
ncbi:L,D-transpeptidase-like protein [Geobacter argillaceus]|uniref:L,D-transpeptidase-like protein n=2 Tax=Geobacter argillaceus TaxID=345631 RepID=A0A562WR69_9BACT|nr:L,D-transpeptidase-like protein [Geobacter argillaceus]